MLDREVVVYGGAFDPPTLAHEEIVRSLGEMYDEVWVLPTHYHRIKKVDPWRADNQYQMYNSEFQDRFAMCAYLFHDIKNVKVVPYEYVAKILDKKYSGATYELNQRLVADHPDIQFHFAIGQDNADSIEKWAYYPKVRDELKYVIFSRGEFPTDAWYTNNPNAFLVNLSSDYDNISSTAAREFLRDPSSIDYDELEMHLPKRIIEYIRGKFS